MFNKKTADCVAAYCCLKGFDKKYHEIIMTELISCLIYEEKSEFIEWLVKGKIKSIIIKCEKMNGGPIIGIKTLEEMEKDNG